MRVEVEISQGEPDYMPMARALLDDLLAFFDEEENEAAFQEWMKSRETRKGA